ncbi:hypothetical protein SODALDRAFT_363013 [Sodiomyces alkalinus F11]|uniref:Uncharacterized protein n=1 Tax=Sodiomyces alkalinus (strain CBS 110278 / VKM F-3762 / F11) TaxID=1314773 RepID=A0A3N2PP04_SODAK|nr:hypothetical protein SODALDRAFT_363013 [Sodiomyces alkalinus F11]ROT36154.1 hypothetical protein SODALDRAFT_363013 [Sodiomyces alkalinus F11]
MARRPRVQNVCLFIVLKLPLEVWVPSIRIEASLAISLAFHEQECQSMDEMDVDLDRNTIGSIDSYAPQDRAGGGGRASVDELYSVVGDCGADHLVGDQFDEDAGVAAPSYSACYSEYCAFKEVARHQSREVVSLESFSMRIQRWEKGRDQRKNPSMETKQLQCLAATDLRI